MINGKNIAKRLRFSSLSYKNQKIIITVVFLLAPVSLVLLFTYIPAISMVGYSFTNWDGISKTKEFVGFKNYEIIFGDLSYFKPMLVSVYYLIGSFIQIGLALLIAGILSFKVKGGNFFKGVFFFPSLINSVAIGFIFLFFFQPNGTLDSVLKLFGMDNTIQFWLRDPKLVNISLSFASVWRYIGYNIVMFSAAMQSVSADVLEAADIDGAGKWKKFHYILVPNISSIIGLNLFMSFSGALTVFEMPYLMTGGGNGTETFMIQAINIAFKNRRVGLASALAIILMLTVIILTTLQKIAFSKRGK